MIIKINERYKLSSEYVATLQKKPCTSLITIKFLNNDTVTYSDGVDSFTDRVINIVPNLSKPDFTFNASKPAVVRPVDNPAPEPATIEPTVNPDPQTTPVSIEPTPTPAPTPEPEPTPTPEPYNPYDENYI